MAMSGDAVAIGTMGLGIRLFNAADLRTKSTSISTVVTSQPPPPTYLQFHQGDILITGTTSGKVDIWDVGNECPVGGFQARGGKYICVTPNAQIL